MRSRGTTVHPIDGREIMSTSTALHFNHAHVLLDALSRLETALDNGAEPWLNYDSDVTDRKTDATGYRALLTELQTGATAVLEGDSLTLDDEDDAQ
jgi:hypothetical protein